MEPDNVDFRSMFDNASVGLIRLNSQRKVLLVNNKAAEIFRFQSVAHFSESVDDMIQLFPPKNHDYIGELIKLGENSKQQDIEMQRSDGEVFRAYLTILFEIKDGQELNINMIVVDLSERFDVTENSKLKGQIRHREQLLFSIINNLPLELLAMDMNGKIILQNSTSKQMWGDLFMKNIYEIGDDSPLSSLKEQISKVSEHETYDFEENISRDNKTFSVRRIITPLITDDKVSGFISLNIDITERVTLEKKVTKALAQETNANQVKEVFLQNISHEIRTPLNAILGFTEILRTRSGNDELNVYMDIVAKSGRRLLDVIQDVLDSSLILTNQVQFQPYNFNLLSLIEEIISKKKFQFNNQDPVSIEIDKDLSIYNDFTKISKVLDCLIDNAYKFSPKKKLITIGCRFNDEEQTHIISVANNGSYIPEEKREVIFEPFRQAQEDLERKSQGNGLGLFISKSYVEFLKGKIWVESDQENGTTFYFSFKIPEKDL